MKLLSRVQLLATLWTVAHQVPPPMGFSRREYWSGLPVQETLGSVPGREDLLEKNRLPTPIFLGFPCGSAGKESACNAGDLGSILGWGDFLEKGKITHSSILAWRIPWTTVHRVPKSGTRLSSFHFHFFFSTSATWEASRPGNPQLPGPHPQ